LCQFDGHYEISIFGYYQCNLRAQFCRPCPAPRY
jgi:hypothetical protein